MARLVLSFLGSWQALLDGQPVTGFESGKVRALLTYLAVEADRPHYREALAGLLWPDLPEAAALANLRQALANLRKTIGEVAAHPPFLLITRETIQFNSASDFTLDLTIFITLLAACDGHPHRNIETCQVCAVRLQQASDLYHGEFLAGFLLSGSSQFEEWTLIWRERLRRLVLDAFGRLAEHYERRASFELAQRILTRQIELDPWREEAHQHLMRVLAHLGQRSAALAQYETCRRVLAEELGVEPTAETIALYEQIKTGEWEGSAKGRPLLLNWSHPTTPLIDRESELAEMRNLITNPACHMLTLLGPGGMGKTRLALEAAADEAWSFTNGAAFVSLTPLNSSEFLVPAMAHAIGFAFHGPTEPRTQLLNYLREKELLLVLDGFERLLAEAGLLADVIEHAPKVVLLVTSRERINLPSEWVLDVQGLPYPHSKLPQKLEAYAAVELFLQRAHMLRSGFSLRQDNERDVSRICQLVEGMPLAIELATAWLPALSCKEIVRVIEGGLGFLAEHHPVLSRPHQSMRAVFDRSWNLLLDDEKSMFRKLSVFRGGFSKEAAEQVTEGTLSVLAALVDKSLVRRTQGSRYEMHDLLRQYAQEKLQEIPDEEKLAHERHCHFFMELLQRELDRFKGPQQGQAIVAIMSETDNVRAAWRWATIHRRIAEMRKPLRTLRWFYDLREVFQEALELYTWTSQHFARIDELADLDREHSIVFWYIESSRAWFMLRLGHYEAARQAMKQGVEQFRQLGAYPEMSDILHLLGIICWLMGEYTEARRLLEKGISIDTETNDEWNSAFKIGTLALVAQSLGEYEQAKQLILQALAIHRKIGDPRLIATGLSFLGPVLFALGELDGAQQFMYEGLAISKALNDRFLTSLTLNHLGLVAYMKGAYRESKQYHLESLALFKEAGDRGQMAVSLSHLGNVSYASRAYQEAHQYYWDALQLASEVRAVPVELDALAGLTAIWLSKNSILPEQACEIVSLIIHHPASTKEVKDRAGQLLNDLESKLPAEIFFAAKQRGASSVLEEAIEEFLSTRET